MIKSLIYWKPIKKIKALLLFVWAYLRTINAKRVINVVKLKLSFVLSARMGRIFVWGKPMAISVEPINICNLKCPECPTGMDILTRSKGMVSVDSFMDMMAQCDNSLWHLNLYFQGEPYMHPDFFTLVKYAKRKSLVVETSTNGQFLSYKQAVKTVESGLDVLVISLDGTTQEVYEKYRVGGELSKVIDGITNLVSAKKELRSQYPIIRAQFLAFQHNQHQIGELKEMAERLGVDMIEIKKAQVYKVEDKFDLLPTAKSLSRYRLLSDGSVKLNGEIQNKCWKHWSSVVSTWKGDVVPCCFDKDGQYTMGNLNEDSLQDIWTKSSFNNFRKRVFEKQAEIDICMNCPLSRK